MSANYNMTKRVVLVYSRNIFRFSVSRVAAQLACLRPPSSSESSSPRKVQLINNLIVNKKKKKKAFLRFEQYYTIYLLKILSKALTSNCTRPLFGWSAILYSFTTWAPKTDPRQYDWDTSPNTSLYILRKKKLTQLVG
jgi:hypothetical protein